MREATQSAISTLKAKQKEKDEKMKVIIMEISGQNEIIAAEKDTLAKEVDDLKFQLAAAKDQ